MVTKKGGKFMQIEAIYNKGIFELPPDIRLSRETFKVIIDFPADVVKKTRQESTNPLDLLLIKYPQDSWLRQMKGIEEKVNSRKEQDLPELSLKQLDNIKAFSQTEGL